MAFVETLGLRERVEREISGFSVPIGKPLIRETYPLGPEWCQLPTVYLVNSIPGRFREESMAKVGFKARELIQIPGKTLIYDENIILTEPQPHEGSEFKYLAEMAWGNDMLYISYGKNIGNRTSNAHWHLPEDFEYYKKLNGSARILHHENDRGMVVPDLFVVPPGVRHQIVADSPNVLFLLLMKNAALRDPALRHIRF